MSLWLTGESEQCSSHAERTASFSLLSVSHRWLWHLATRNLPMIGWTFPLSGGAWFMYRVRYRRRPLWTFHMCSTSHEDTYRESGRGKSWPKYQTPEAHWPSVSPSSVLSGKEMRTIIAKPVHWTGLLTWLGNTRAAGTFLLHQPTNRRSKPSPTRSRNRGCTVFHNQMPRKAFIRKTGTHG